MLSVSLELLKENKIENISALGGGTALAAYYWNHRYSTDINIFIYSKGKTIDKLRSNLWSDKVTKRMKDIGFYGDFKMHPIYTELVIDENSKMQFFDVNNYTKDPYNRIKLWDLECNIESIGEIIAKKIYYRCEKGNARNLFDIALAIHKKPDILNSLNIKQEKIYNNLRK
jgi:predicted nucleotidyltransferase component of viral defense system